MERTVKKAKERLEQSKPDEEAEIDDKAEREERIAFLEAEIEGLTTQMEQYGEEGEVEKAQELLEKVEQLKQNIEVVKNVGVTLSVSYSTC
jgi:DNA repair ATPase RecN